MLRHRNPVLPETRTINASNSTRDTTATATFKLADVASRLLFLLSTLLLLDQRSAGQFGLLNTLVALFALFVGFERWGVLWRKLANSGSEESGALIASTLRFFQFNYLVWTLVFMAAAYFWIDLTWFEVGLGLCIAICEQLSVGAYWLATVQGRYRGLILITALKNAGMLGVLGVLILGFSYNLTITTALQIWAIAGIVSVLVFSMMRSGKHAFLLRPTRNHFLEITAQYRESRAHFLMGVAAFSSGQIDRIIVGTALGLAMTGIYFKNILLAASVYSAMTILLHNRAVPRIYSEVGKKQYDTALEIARRDSIKAAFAYATLAVSISVGGQQDFIAFYLKTYSISSSYLVGLLVAFLLRTLSDYNCTLLNAASQENWVLVIHASSIPVSALLIFLMARSFGIGGAVVAMMTGCAIQFIISEFCRNKVLGHQR